MQEVATNSFYLNWTFWAVLVSAVAILFSQIPPIHLLLKKAELDVELYARIWLSHNVGNSNLQLHLILRNIGGRLVRVKGSNVLIKRDGKDIVTLPAQTYYQNPSDSNAVLFTSFSLKPKEEWAHPVNFSNYLNRSDEKKFKKASSELKKDILNKIKLRTDEKSYVEADAQHVAPFHNLFKELFMWESGDYELQFCIDVEPISASLKKNYRFILFESDSVELSEYVKDYKYGEGIYFQSNKHSGIVVEIIETI